MTPDREVALRSVQGELSSGTTHRDDRPGVHSLGESQLREVVLIVGNYTQLAMFQNTLGAQLEPGIDGLPDEAR